MSGSQYADGPGIDMVDGMERPDWAPAGIDLDRPSAARVYDYYLGGFHNFAADREMGRQAVEMWPHLPRIMQANRAFLRRAVTFAAGQGVRQFLDLGSGIPTAGNVHEVAQGIAPDARVVYVDNDPVAVAHSRSILDADPQTIVVEADARDPGTVLSDPMVAAALDFDRPVAILMVALLHFFSDEDRPGEVIAKYRDAAPTGSYLVLSHASAEGPPGRAAGHRDLYRRTATPMTMRSREQVVSFFQGFDLVDPGVVYLPLWRPVEAGADPGAGSVDPQQFPGLAGVGSKS
jgi:hypothetical protein